MIYELVWLNPWVFAIALNTVLISLGVIAAKKLLTPAGWIHAWILGVLIWGCLGWRGYLIVVFYFLVGSGVTRIGKAQKEAAGIAEKRGGARGPENVWGSALTGMLCGLGVFFLPLGFPDLIEIQSWIPLLILGYVASFSTKLSDTCGSEIGKAYGQQTFLITTLKPVPRGTEGAVSLEGTLAGVGASIVVSVLAWSLGLIDVWGILWSVIAAFVATNLESVIGATLQTKWTWLTNEVVNFINTLIGAITAIFFAYLWQLF
ncbi:TIGR00297 family protein [Planktothrix paucivesiculata]|uniref:TIGR00297 family protein n=1 Tax=Planktothrix paucivesiculata PCC 9631 TaxID=671071 RepID=A0A7Z9BR19_9CYAN|nr:TIGR00297 family protein [Planktothrix paucivesiculata]VXD20588.1 conserved membrane hypothetical protein [Planktothrix paucivesiculata PCC 9631]